MRDGVDPPLLVWLLMNKIVVTGAAGDVGERVVAKLTSAQPRFDVLAVDRTALPSLPPGVETKRVDLEFADLRSLFCDADTVVHLSSRGTPGKTDPKSDELDLLIAKRILDAAADCRVGQLVLLSTALVYGARTANPIPLTEDAPVRPNPDFSWAVARAEIEKMTAEWKTDHRSTAVSVLRPTAIVTDDDLGQLARVLHSARLGVAADGDPPVQYLHIDDLVSAVMTAVVCRADGPLNVAPDGWIPPDSLRDLEGPKPRLRVPLWMARGLAAVRWQAGLAPIPPGVVPYTSHSWVIASDRLRALGWEPAYSNEEAWVVSHNPGPLDWVPARRRQELALAIAALGVLGGLGVLVWLLRRVSRVRRTGS